MKFLVKILLLLVVILVTSNICFAQSNLQQGVNFSFKLTDEKSEEDKSTFRVGEEIVIRLSLANNSNDLVPYTVTDNHYLYKFSLTKDDDLLPVANRSDKATILSIREETRGIGRQLMLDPIMPGEVWELASLKISDRYENLKPGKYKLMIEYKTSIYDEKTKKVVRLSNEAIFEIVQ